MIWIALRYGGVWLLLLFLLGAAAATAYLDLRGKGPLLHLGVAALQVFLVWFLFMDLRRASGLVRLSAAAGLLWLAIMFMLAFSDYATRGWNEAPTGYPDKIAAS